MPDTILLQDDERDDTAEGMRAADPSVDAASLTDEEQLLYLIAYLRDERVRRGAHTNRIVPTQVDERRAYLRGLFNMRPPEPAAPRFLEVQDAYLQRRLIERGGPIDAASMPPYKGDDAAGIDAHISLWQGDATLLKVDAVVNAATRDLLGCSLPGHNCIDNAIHTYAGIQLRLECNEIMTEQGHPENPGHAKITAGYNLPAKHVLHTLGPVAAGDLPTKRQVRQLGDCYRACLSLAAQNGLESIAFCCISTGVFGFPRSEAAHIAVDAVRGYLKENDAKIHVIFDMFRDDDMHLYEEILA